MTFYGGVNPSFIYNSPLPLFGDLLRRAKRLEADGSVRLMEGAPADLQYVPANCSVRRSANGLLVARDIGPGAMVNVPGAIDGGHPPSFAALAYTRPCVLRTLDWSMANKRTDWSLPRVLPLDMLQGSDRGMAVELQAYAAEALNCTLWWNAPPRYELERREYEVRLEEMLRAIKASVTRPPVLEYGNELWNDGFPVKGWLVKQANGSASAFHGTTPTWHDLAAEEIATLKRVADRVFGPPGPLGARPYYLFVGGQLTVPSHLDRILSALADLGVTPDLAGPALYVTPLKAQKDEWEATGAVPTQNELRASCFARLAEIVPTIDGPESSFGQLRQHNLVRTSHSVPYFACYEAGQSLIAGAHPWRKAAIEAQGTEWMGDLYREIRRAAEAAGVDLLNWYSAATDQAPTDPRVDVFGLLPGYDLAKAPPKAKAARGE